MRQNESNIIKHKVKAVTHEYISMTHFVSTSAVKSNGSLQQQNKRKHDDKMPHREKRDHREIQMLETQYDVHTCGPEGRCVERNNVCPLNTVQCCSIKVAVTVCGASLGSLCVVLESIVMNRPDCSYFTMRVNSLEN